MLPAGYHEEFCTHPQQRYYEQLDCFLDQFIAVLRQQIAANEAKLRSSSQPNGTEIIPAAIGYTGFRKCLQRAGLQERSFIIPELLYLPPAAPAACANAHRETPRQLHEIIKRAKNLRVQSENQALRTRILEGDLAQALYQEELLQKRVSLAARRLQQQKLENQLNTLRAELRETIVRGLRDAGLASVFGIAQERQPHKQ